jgi:hypothetical protein
VLPYTNNILEISEIEKSYPAIEPVKSPKKHVDSSSDGEMSNGSSEHNMDMPEAPDITNKMRHYNTRTIHANKVKTQNRTSRQILH